MIDTSGVNEATDKTNVPPYLLLEIEEFVNKFEGTSKQFSDCFYRLGYYDLIDPWNY